MIASGYTIHLYCDCCPKGHPASTPPPAEFFDERPAVAWRLARRAGWSFRLRAGRPYLAKCPRCAGLGRKFPTTAEE